MFRLIEKKKEPFTLGIHKVYGPLQVVCIVIMIPQDQSIQIDKTLSRGWHDPKLATNESLQNAPVAQAHWCTSWLVHPEIIYSNKSLQFLRNSKSLTLEAAGVLFAATQEFP